MRISARIDYACRALLELSLHWPSDEPLQINIIGERQNIPIKFLTQILINLKQLGYTKSVRGKNGGYLLAKAPKDIKLSNLIQSLGRVGYAHSDSLKDEDPHVMQLIWQEMDKVVIDAMDKINFETVANRKRASDNTVIFDI